MMISEIPDQSARERALDPQCSFIVQAPAGSGKTELLTQRFLVLLAHAQQTPEEIIAITFTRKASAEMRGRILAALQRGHSESKPNAAHAAKTWELAQAVLEKDRTLGWDLLANPQRLKILTIDSLCASLTRQMPILSRLGGANTITEDAQPLYERAARKILASLEYDEPWVAALENLLLHVDNHHAKAEQLMVEMLAKRDQWLPYLGTLPEAREHFEQALANVLIENIEKVALAIHTTDTSELIALAHFAANHLPASAITSPLASCGTLQQLPAIDLTHYSQWLGIAQLLLTQAHQWRRKFTSQEGFPAPTGTKDKQEKALFTAMKNRMTHYLAQCAQNEGLLLALQDLLASPPITYTDQQWAIILSLLELLPLLVAHLRLEFQLQGCVDYIEITTSALTALGEEEHPTDLALALDYRIQHILIDEFQDTSANQYRLLEKLTAGWQPGDGRSLFLVGDPMQSIYRFRKAEVGLFLRARDIGIGAISLESLTLSANFRSQQPIVTWINEAFSKILPRTEDISSGAVSYHPAIAIRQGDESAGVCLYPCYQADYQQEAQQIIQIIQATVTADPSSSIAILVRAKTHLSAILPALQAANIAYRAVDIDPLIQRQTIQDLLALTRALLHPADRIAWLAILRAPWCGLTLSDLQLLAGIRQEKTIWDLLQQIHRVPISKDGKLRLRRLIPILEQRIQQRRRLPLQPWIEGAWLALGGPACLTAATDLDDAQTYFKLLAQLDIGGDIADFNELYTRLQTLFASPAPQTSINVDIMSIHKSKGLEFDTVIIPGLGRELPTDDAQLMLWMERPQLHGGTELLVAPMRAADEDADPIYNFLRREETKKAHYETARLLYVATTRAKKNLHLLGHCLLEPTPEIKLKKPSPRSLLAQLWPQVEAIFQQRSQQLTPNDDRANANTVRNKLLRRLATDWQIPEHLVTTTPTQHPLNYTPQLVTLTFEYPFLQLHALLRRILPSAVKNPIDFNVHVPYFQHALQAKGINEIDLARCLTIIKAVLQNLPQDRQNHWLFQQPASETEFLVTLAQQKQVTEYLVDWSFIDQQQHRWLVYYNFIPTDNTEPKEFIAIQKQCYVAYLDKIIPALQHHHSTTHHCGVYFPLLKHWEQIC